MRKLQLNLEKIELKKLAKDKDKTHTELLNELMK
jgi:hypothetical protein